MDTNTHSMDDRIKLAEIGRDVLYIKDDMTDIKRIVTENYVTKEEFLPVKRLVYGAVGVIGVGVIGGILTLLGLRTGTL